MPAEKFTGSSTFRPTPKLSTKPRCGWQKNSV